MPILHDEIQREQDLKQLVADQLIGLFPKDTEYRFSNAIDVDRPVEFEITRKRTKAEREADPTLPKWMRVGGIPSDDFRLILRTSPGPLAAARRVYDYIWHKVPATNDPSAQELRNTIATEVTKILAARLEELKLMGGVQVDPAALAEAIQAAQERATQAANMKVLEQQAVKAEIPRGVQGKPKGIGRIEKSEKEERKNETRLLWKKLCEADWKDLAGVPIKKAVEPPIAAKSGPWFAKVQREWRRFEQAQMHKDDDRAVADAEAAAEAEAEAAKARVEGEQ